MLQKIEKIFESEYTLEKIIKINPNSIYLSAYAKNNYYVMHLNSNNGVSLCNRINIKKFSFASQIVYNDISKSFYYIKKKSLFAVKEENFFKDKFIVDLISTAKWYKQLRIQKTTVSENGNFFVTTTEKSFSVFSTKDSSLLYEDKLQIRENHYLDNIFILENDLFLFSVSSYGFGGYTLVYNAKKTGDGSMS